jgi:hypothetical protein
MLDHSCQVQRHTHAERGLDLYETPSVAVEGLRRVEKIPHCVWENAAGRGAIVRVLRDHGHAVIASDIHDYGFPLHFQRDFLAETAMPVSCECILTNPPYQWVEEFVAHALELSPKVIMLLRLAFMESERRCHILENRGLARIHVFRKRLPMMHRGGWEGRKANSGMAFAWFVWDRTHRGPPPSTELAGSGDAMKHARDTEAVKPALLSVYSGQTCVGHIVGCGKAGFEAFDADEKSLGIFPSEKTAADAVSENAP